MATHQWIEDVLEVLTHIQRIHSQQGQRPVAELRVEATHIVARRRARGFNTIANAYLRMLRFKVEAFDRALEDWLAGQPARLRDRLRHCAQAGEDRRRVDGFFDYLSADATGSDEQLSIPGLSTGKRRAGARRTSPRRPVSVVLDNDVAKVFPDSDAVNQALRLLIQAAGKAQSRTP